MRKLTEVSPDKIDPRLIEPGIVRQESGTIAGILVGWPASSFVTDQITGAIDALAVPAGAKTALRLLTEGAIFAGGLTIASVGGKQTGMTKDLLTAAGLTTTAVGAFSLLTEVGRMTGLLGKSEKAGPMRQIREVMVPPEEEFLPPLE